MFPDVGSINVSPGLIRPDFSASSTMRSPIRSLTDPPALKYSHLAYTLHFRLEETLFSLTRGLEGRTGEEQRLERQLYTITRETN